MSGVVRGSNFTSCKSSVIVTCDFKAFLSCFQLFNIQMVMIYMICDVSVIPRRELTPRISYNSDWYFYFILFCIEFWWLEALLCVSGKRETTCLSSFENEIDSWLNRTKVCVNGVYIFYTTNCALRKCHFLEILTCMNNTWFYLCVIHVCVCSFRLNFKLFEKKFWRINYKLYSYNHDCR